METKVYYLEVCRADKIPTSLTTAATLIPELVRWPFGFVYIENISGRKVLVDTGVEEEEWFVTHAPMHDLMGVKRFGSTVEALARINVKPDEITDIILTHLHSDHAGGISYFPKATFYLQKAELQQAVVVPEFKATTQAYNVNNIVDITRLAFEGRVQFLDGDQELFEGIHAYMTPGHTAGHQIVTVRTSSGLISILGDLTHLFENFVEEKLGAIYCNQTQYLQSIQKVKKISGFNYEKAIIFHGINVIKFPEIADHIYKVN